MFFTPNLVIGLTIMAVGAALLLDTLGIREAASLIKYWPGLIVLFGASLVAQAFTPVDPAAPKKANGGTPCFFLFLLAVAMFGYFGFPDGSVARAGARATATGIMGNARSGSVGADVRSGRVAALMGRSSLDLRQVKLGPGDSYTVKPPRPHLVVNGGEDSATFLVLQGIGEYDFVPLVELTRK